MKPFPSRSLNEKQLLYNHRLSRCRRTIKNVFGILVARWRILRRPIRASVNTVEEIIKACVCLHNYLKQTDSASYVPSGLVDSFDHTGNITEGSWRSIVSSNESALQPIQRNGSNNYTKNAKLIRENFKGYFNSQTGSIPRQLKHVRSCGEPLI